MKNKLIKMVPPGYDYMYDLKALGWALAVSSAFSLSFIFKFGSAYESLYDWKLSPTGEKVLRPGAVMPDFVNLLGNSMAIFLASAVLMLILAVFHYNYYIKDSKSIYLMKRLPDKTLLLKTVSYTPLIAAGLCLAAGFIVLLLYFWLYMGTTPDQCLTPCQWEKLWSVIL